MSLVGCWGRRHMCHGAALCLLGTRRGALGSGLEVAHPRVLQFWHQYFDEYTIFSDGVYSLMKATSKAFTLYYNFKDLCFADIWKHWNSHLQNLQKKRQRSLKLKWRSLQTSIPISREMETTFLNTQQRLMKCDLLTMRFHTLFQVIGINMKLRN